MTRVLSMVVAAIVMASAGACSSTSGKPAGVAGPTGTAEQKRAAGIVDQLLEESWRQAKVTPAPAIGDGEFLRRVSLDLVGRVPTLAEVRAFSSDTTPDKRARLVDRLLASPELGEHWADVYADLLWKTDGSNRIEKQDPRAYLVTAFNENRPYDRLATELLTATGDVRDNGAVAFVAARARGGGGPEAVAGAAARIFLGLSIQCAQCHDHPYDTRWKQQDFYGLVAYFARTKVRRQKTPKEMAQMAADMGTQGEGDMAGMDAMVTMPGKPGVSFSVNDVRRGEAKMRAPRSESEVRVEPRFLGRTAVSLSPAESRRQALARAVIASDLFPKAMVARTWAQLFGAGLMDPWDDLGAESDPRHPPLLSTLAADFRGSGFDLKALLRRIVLSRAYDRSSMGSGPGDSGAAVRAFAQAKVRPLSPAQLFRTLTTMTAADEIVRVRQREERAERLLARTLKEYKFTFEDDEMADADFDGSMPQALLLLNGELTNNATRAAEGGVLGGILAESKSPAARLESMFLAVYARPPSDEERALFLPALESPGRNDARNNARGNRAPYEDLFFALATSTEAVTNH